jgi:hypothetical protein
MSKKIFKIKGLDPQTEDIAKNIISVFNEMQLDELDILFEHDIYKRVCADAEAHNIIARIMK